MKKLNRKGFTLVELLAVIVILALVMGVGAVSMTSVINNSRKNSMKSSAVSYVTDTPTLLLGNGDLSNGYFYISNKMLQQGGITSPWGNYVYNSAATSATKGYVKSTTDLTCGGTSGSWIKVDGDDSTGAYLYTICLYDDAGHYIYGTASNLTDSNTAEEKYYIGTDANSVVELRTVDGVEKLVKAS